MDSLKDDQTRRVKFIRHFGHFGSSLRFPVAYSQFRGKPNGLHEHIKFDALGFRNLNKPGYLFDGNHPRVFVLGGSTMVEGIDENDTVAGRLQSVLQAGRFSKAQVYNCCMST